MSAFRKLGADFDRSSRVGFRSGDSKTIHFNAGVTVTTRLHALDIETGAVRQLTEERAALSVSRDEDTGTIPIGYSDPKTPPTVFTVASVDDVPDRSARTQLVDVNPQVRDIAPGEEVEINRRSSDGKMVGGVLVCPVGYGDIMNGVDHLIDQGIVDGDRMGALGWSAGGHWSNRILTRTTASRRSARAPGR